MVTLDGMLAVEIVNKSEVILSRAEIKAELSKRVGTEISQLQFMQTYLPAIKENLTSLFYNSAVSNYLSNISKTVAGKPVCGRQSHRNQLNSHLKKVLDTSTKEYWCSRTEREDKKNPEQMRNRIRQDLVPHLDHIITYHSKLSAQFENETAAWERLVEESRKKFEGKRAEYNASTNPQERSVLYYYVNNEPSQHEDRKLKADSLKLYIAVLDHIITDVQSRKEKLALAQ